MKLEIHAKPNSKKPGIEKKENLWIVRVKERAVDGKANQAIIEAVAKELSIAPSSIIMLRGFQSKFKLLEITTDNINGTL